LISSSYKIKTYWNIFYKYGTADTLTADTLTADTLTADTLTADTLTVDTLTQEIESKENPHRILTFSTS
jgi:hypothetical protein